jgi:hypothetical protein
LSWLRKGKNRGQIYQFTKNLIKRLLTSRLILPQKNAIKDNPFWGNIYNKFERTSLSVAAQLGIHGNCAAIVWHYLK